MTPNVIEQGPHGGERVYDLWSCLLKERIIFIGTEIDDHVANLVVGQLLFLEAQDPEKVIMLYINSPGGDCTAGFAIYDTMQYLRPPISTICVGQACSMAALLLAAGGKGMRKALPRARIMIHQPWSGLFQGQASDIQIEAEETLKIRDICNEILVDHCGQPLEKIEADTNRNLYMSAKEAKEYGLLDEVVRPRKAKSASVEPEKD